MYSDTTFCYLLSKSELSKLSFELPEICLFYSVLLHMIIGLCGELLDSIDELAGTVRGKRY